MEEIQKDFSNLEENPPLCNPKTLLRFSELHAELKEKRNERSILDSEINKIKIELNEINKTLTGLPYLDKTKTILVNTDNPKRTFKSIKLLSKQHQKDLKNRPGCLRKMTPVSMSILKLLKENGNLEPGQIVINGNKQISACKVLENKKRLITKIDGVYHLSSEGDRIMNVEEVRNYIDKYIHYTSF